ncbi:MAG: response regulator transcription factor [Nocardiopsaceae bacterium]|nr:response regulator transcription factor [Nocardiopsaceae bacterium]
MPTDQPMRAPLLIVEDDAEIAVMLDKLLTEEGYEVDVAADGQRGLHLALTRSYQVLIVDRVLPVMDGLDLLRRIRRSGVAVPVLVLTALGTVADRVAGLDSGAEDYLVKPFEVDELLARVRALLRRHRDAARTLSLGGGELDLVRREVWLPDGAAVDLSRREFELLQVLASHPRRVYTRAELRAKVFEETRAGSVVDTYVHYLRRKLGRRAVRTVRGFGYQAGEL